MKGAVHSREDRRATATEAEQGEYVGGVRQAADDRGPRWMLFTGRSSTPLDGVGNAPKLDGTDASPVDYDVGRKGGCELRCVARA